ncbi:MAG: hypothetical protein V2I43_13455 [Parvularcula sp.]|jgi:hypothetical protein|nr:hypothetical protein [Parvularcula sp.]
MSRSDTRNVSFRFPTAKLPPYLAGSLLVVSALALPILLLTQNERAESRVPYITIAIEGAPDGS